MQHCNLCFREIWHCRWGWRAKASYRLYSAVVWVAIARTNKNCKQTRQDVATLGSADSADIKNNLFGSVCYLRHDQMLRKP